MGILASSARNRLERLRLLEKRLLESPDGDDRLVLEALQEDIRKLEEGGEPWDDSRDRIWA